MNMQEDVQEFAHTAADRAALEAARDENDAASRLTAYEAVYKGVFKVVRETLVALPKD